MINIQLPINFPLVSVIIPAYNAQEFIERTLKSVLSQTYKNIEVIVIDDGSQDNTAQIVKIIANQDQRVILLQQSNSGVAVARNSGIQKSKGEFIAPIDADDLWHPQNIEKQVQCMIDSPSSVGVIYAWSLDIDENDSPTGGFRAATIEGEVYLTLIGHNFIGNASATLIRRTCLEEVGGYDYQLKQQQAQGCEDWDLYLRIAEFYQFRAVSEFLIGYRKIFRSMSADYTQMAKSQTLMLQAVRDKHPEISVFLFRLSQSSFYMYLAWQSNQYGESKNTLYWLFQAVKIDYLTPLFRLGFYVLLVKSWYGLIFHPIRNEKINNFPKQGSFLNPESLKLDSKKFLWSLKLKLVVGSSFHKVMSLIFKPNKIKLVGELNV